MALTPRPSGTAEQLAVSLGNIKLHLRVGHSIEDEDLELRAWAAQRAIAHHVGPIVSSDWEWWLPRFECGYLSLPAYEVSLVESIGYYPASGGVQPFTDWVFASGMKPGQLHCLPGKAWPSDTLMPGAGVVVRMTAGWPVGAVPEPIRAAILLMVGHLYVNREAVTLEAATPRELPMGVASLCEPYRVHGAGWLA